MKRFLKIFISILLSAVLIFLTMVTFYLPKYIQSDAKVNINTEDDGSITLMSTNVRYVSYEDFFKRSWFYRADLVCEDINSVQPDIIGFQEATPIHYEYLKKILVGYDNEMAYRDNFILSEGCPIFYRTDKFEKVDSGSFWLSETPEVMSKDWGSEHYRICVYVILREISTGKEFAVFNTHLDHTSDEARINGIQVVLDKISEFGDLPAYLMGDLNAKEDSKTIQSTKESFDDGKPIVKRVIATEGQWVDINFAEGIVYVGDDLDNLVALEEPYTKSLTTNPEGVTFPLQVSEGSIFVLGDNRERSKDSRSPEIGLIDEREILGKVIFLFYPGTNGVNASGKPNVPREFGRIGVVS